VNGDAKAPKFKVRSEDDDWQAHLYNQERMINQQDELIVLHKNLIVSLEKVASPERVRGVEEGQTRMTAAVDNLSKQMSGAQVQLEAAVAKLGGMVFGMMKIPVAVVVVGAASWAFLYAEKISERTWLLMITISVFPWLSDGIYAILNVIGIKRKNGENAKS
jgi:hypothetical protein